MQPEVTLAPERVRSVTLDNVVVDTGATTLCLPATVISQLGLELLKEVEVRTANGFSQARIFRDATLLLLGREGTFECLELPEDEILYWACYRWRHWELNSICNVKR